MEICCSNICCILVVSDWKRAKGLGIPPGRSMPPAACGKKGFMPFKAFIPGGSRPAGPELGRWNGGRCIPPNG